MTSSGPRAHVRLQMLGQSYTCCCGTVWWWFVGSWHGRWASNTGATLQPAHHVLTQNCIIKGGCDICNVVGAPSVILQILQDSHTMLPHNLDVSCHFEKVYRTKEKGPQQLPVMEGPNKNKTRQHLWRYSWNCYCSPMYIRTEPPTGSSTLSSGFKVNFNTFEFLLDVNALVHDIFSALNTRCFKSLCMYWKGLLYKPHLFPGV